MRLTLRGFVQRKWWLPENMFIFTGRYLRRRQPTSIFSPQQSYSTSPDYPSSKLYTKYGFKLPTSLKPVENPDPQPIKSPRKTKPKPPYKPPSSLEGVELAHSELPFDFRFSYTESNSKVRPIGLREPKYSPFGPNRLDRVWTGVCAPVIDPKEGCVESEKELEDKRRLLREKIQGEALSNAERKVLVESCSRRKSKQQINLGRDGLTHNMLDDIHNHWKHAEAVRIKCMGVPTIDMKNICAQLEDKTFGQIICRHGGLLVLYRGRNYHPRKRPMIPLMLWKPQEPVYPKLIKTTIEGLSIEETKQLRKRGLSVPALTKLGRNGYYGRLVPMVRDAFLADELVRIDCQGLDRSDYKKIGCKLKDLVPCILVTFAKEQVVVWKGKEYTPIHDGFFLSERELFDDDDDVCLQSPDKNDKPKENRGEGRRYFESDDD